MGFRDVINQEQAKEFLKSSIASGRVSSGYLFHGPRGVGKATLALAFAQALNCEKKDPDGCGECPTCTRISRFVHPDVTHIFPTSGKNANEEIGATHEVMRKNKLFIHTFPSAATIKIRTIQDLRMDLAMGVRETKHRVIILAYAERMTDEASNCLLRILEEPAPGDRSPRVTFVLTATSRNGLLPTIVSRCQAVHLVPLSAQEIQRVLMENKDKIRKLGAERDNKVGGHAKNEKDDVKNEITAEEAAIIARLSAGSLSAAVELAQQDIVKYRQEKLDALRTMSSKSPAEIVAIAEGLAAPYDRNQVRIFVHLALLWLRDLLLLKCNGRETDLAHVDLIDELRREASGIDLKELRRRIDILEDIIDSMERNVDISLLLSASFLKLAGIVKDTSPFVTDRPY